MLRALHPLLRQGLRIIALLSLMPASLALAQTKAPDPKRLQLESTKAVVYDAQTGQVLYAKNANNTAPIASITKLMTAMVVLEIGRAHV